jgi:DNA-directed RNA polymerase subunit alpha
MSLESYSKIIKPKKIVASENDNIAKIAIEPLQKGFGTTLGNSLRRVLLSSIRGSVFSSVQITGVKHEYDAMASSVQDVVQICLNLRKVVIKTDLENSIATLKISGAKKVTAGMISVPLGVEILNKDLFLFETTGIQDVEILLKISSGLGYVVHDIKTERPIGELLLDCYYSPVLNVGFSVDNARVDGFTEHDKLIISIETNGSITPQDAISVASGILRDFLKPLMSFDDEDFGVTEFASEVKKADDIGFDLNLLRRTDDLELSVRSANCLTHAGIKYIGELIQRNKDEMLKMPNFGRKSLDELCAILDNMDLKFGMPISSWPPKNMDQLLELAKKKFESE